MVISNLNTARILELIRFIDGCLEELTSFSAMTEKDFLSEEIASFIRTYEEKVRH